MPLARKMAQMSSFMFVHDVVVVVVVDAVVVVDVEVVVDIVVEVVVDVVVWELHNLQQ